MLINYDKEELKAVDSRNYANIVETLHNQATCGTEENGCYKEVAIAERFSPAFFYEIKTKGNGIIGVNIFLCTSIRMHKKGQDNSFLTILLIMLIIAHMKSVCYISFTYSPKPV